MFFYQCDMIHCIVTVAPFIDHGKWQKIREKWTEFSLSLKFFTFDKGGNACWNGVSHTYLAMIPEWRCCFATVHNHLPISLCLSIDMSCKLSHEALSWFYYSSLTSSATASNNGVERTYPKKIYQIKMKTKYRWWSLHLLHLCMSLFFSQTYNPTDFFHRIQVWKSKFCCNLSRRSCVYWLNRRNSCSTN